MASYVCRADRSGQGRRRRSQSFAQSSPIRRRASVGLASARLRPLGAPYLLCRPITRCIDRLREASTPTAHSRSIVLQCAALSRLCDKHLRRGCRHARLVPARRFLPCSVLCTPSLSCPSCAHCCKERATAKLHLRACVHFNFAPSQSGAAAAAAAIARPRFRCGVATGSGAGTEAKKFTANFLAAAGAAARKQPAVDPTVGLAPRANQRFQRVESGDLSTLFGRIADRTAPANGRQTKRGCWTSWRAARAAPPPSSPSCGSPCTQAARDVGERTRIQLFE